MAAPPGTSSSSIFPGTGESATIMRAIDWSATPLGPTESWPQSLRTIVPIMLTSRFPMRVLWGPEFIFLYNDSYRPILGASKHPTAMASRTSESFRELWHIVGPLFHRVYGGETIALEDTLLPLDRNGYLEECFFTVSYSPMMDDEGRIAGSLGVVHETTAHVVSARRMRTLRELAATVSAAASPEIACERAARVLERNPADVAFAAFYLVQADAERFRLVARAGLDENPSALPEFVELSARGQPDEGWPLARARATGESLVVTDVEARFGSLVSGAYPEPIRCALVVPLRRTSSGETFGFFLAGVSPRRALDDPYRGFFELVEEQISGATTEALQRQERDQLVAREHAADARLRLLFNEAPAAIAVLRGVDHVFELANPLFCQLVGRTNVLGRRGRDVLPELDAQGIWSLFDKVFASGAPFEGREFQATLNRNANGSLDVGFFNFVLQPTRDLEGRIEGVVLFAVEITEQVRARRTAEAGRAERTQLLASERAARDDAERSNQAKDEFLAIVSHELRNPLSAILGWTRLLRSGTLAVEKHERALETIERNAVNQAQLIEDLLDVSRIISGKLRLDVRLVSFVDVVRAAIESARPALDAKQIRLKAVLDSEAISLMGDATRLQQVVWNLLSNAAKFTPKGGSIQIVLKRVGSALQLAVIDSGRGIAPEFLPHVFDRFRQADASTTRVSGGLGLGLSIAKNLVEMHGGTISAHSQGEGKGATFTVHFPVAPLRESAPSEPRTGTRARTVAGWSSPPELTGLKILVVDDEADTREMVAEVLEYCGSQVARSGSAREAMVALDAFHPDVILSDIGMPDVDGFALIQQIRSRPAANGGVTPAASLTAYAGAEDRRRALLMGFNMHVPKPVEPEELVAVVASLGRMARALR